jgi:hypothetical protein
MNKILIVGHPQSGYQEVESLLNECGMSAALPSRREGFTAAEIGTTLCKVHKAQPLHQLGMDQQIDQVETSPVWHGMALDLMLGNVDQELWGWADPSSVYLLDYWKSLDQKITFILVYNSPETLLGDSAQNGHLSEEALAQRAHVWQAYNAALLHFYYRNRERCLLVHASQVRHSANKTLQQVRARIGAPLAERKELLALGDETAAQSQATLTVATGTALQAEEGHAGVTALPSDEAALEQYLAQALISQQPQVLQLYAELQAVANLPLTEDAAPGIHALQAWRGLSAMHALTRQIADRAEQQKDELHRAQQDIQRLTLETQATTEQIAQHLATQSKLQAVSQEQQQENELIVLQLHQVQEELERFYLEAQQQKEKIKALQEAEKLANERAKSLEQLRQEKAKLASEKESAAKLAAERNSQNDDLKKQLAKQAEVVRAREAELQKATATPVVNPELQQENELLLAQLYQVQEELECYYLENQRLKKNQPAPAKQPLSGIYGAADRVKSHLAYRLGNVMLKNYRTLPGLACLPWALLRETRQFRFERDQAKGTKLPPLHQYRDAREGEKIKGYLTYRLGATLIAHSKSPVGWVKLPLALGREVKTYKKKRQAA